MKKIVTIGGGSGQYILLSGLRDLEDLDIKAIVSMVDSGGSTGRLRDEYGVLPPGDILKCTLALSPHREVARKIFQARFSSHERLIGHNSGNMLLTILSEYAGSFPAGVGALCEALETKGKILPVTLNKATLVAELTDGSMLYGETAIDIPRGNQRQKIKNVFLVPHHGDKIEVYPPVIDAIREADHVIIGPGDLFTSIVPNFLVPGVKEILQETGAEITYIVNIMTKFGETDNYTAADFVNKIEEYLNREINNVILNTGRLEDEILARYTEQKARFVEEGLFSRDNKTVIAENILDSSGGIIRHSPESLAEVICKIIF